MPINVVCKCGASFAAKDELAGKAVRCPKCKQPLQIPAPAQAPANTLDDLFDEAGIGAKQGPSCPKCHAELKPNAILCVACGFEFQTGAHREGVKIREMAHGGHGEAAESLLARAAKQIEYDKAEDRKNISHGAPAYVYLFGLLVIVAFATMMFTLPKGLAFFITGIAVCGFSYLVMIYYQIRWIIVAFQEGPLQGALHLVPGVNSVYSIYYLITRWDRVGEWFIAQLKMIPLLLLGGLFMLLGNWLGFEYPEKTGTWLHDQTRPRVACVVKYESESVNSL